MQHHDHTFLEEKKIFISRVMNPVHADLLRSIGVEIAEQDIYRSVDQPACKSPVLPNRPHHFDSQGVAVFTSEQIHWADPKTFGFKEDYYVVEEEETSHPWALNYSDEILLPRKRPVHRYSRFERFKSILGQLMGCSGNVPKEVLQAFQGLGLERLPKDQLWDTVRANLKAHRWRMYYNRIPAILSGLGLNEFKFANDCKFRDILHDFELMDNIFKHLKKHLGRTYFPNLRFVAIKLMQRHGLEPCIPIPLARTQRKLQALEDVYETIWKHIDEKHWDDFFTCLFS